MVSESEIRDRLAVQLRGDLSLDDFEDWLVSQSWNMHQWASQADQRLAFAIELRLAEHDAGHLSDEDLARELRQLLQIPPAQPIITVSSASATVFNMLQCVMWSFPTDVNGTSGTSSEGHQTERLELITPS